MLMKNLITEVASFKTLGDRPDSEIIEIVSELEREFHGRQEGFIDSELFHDAREETWHMVQHWRSLDEARASSREMMRSDITTRFREALDPGTVTIRFYPCLGRWSAASD